MNPVRVKLKLSAFYHPVWLSFLIGLKCKIHFPAAIAGKFGGEMTHKIMQSYFCFETVFNRSFRVSSLSSSNHKPVTHPSLMYWLKKWGMVKSREELYAVETKLERDKNVWWGWGKKKCLVTPLVYRVNISMLFMFKYQKNWGIGHELYSVPPPRWDLMVIVPGQTLQSFQRLPSAVNLKKCSLPSSAWLTLFHREVFSLWKILLCRSDVSVIPRFCSFQNTWFNPVTNLCGFRQERKCGRLNRCKNLVGMPKCLGEQR